MATGHASFEWWTINDEGDMLERLQALKADGYRGSLQLTPDGVWSAELNAPGENLNPIPLRVGDVLVMIGGVLQSMTTEVYTARFGS